MIIENQKLHINILRKVKKNHLRSQLNKYGGQKEIKRRTNPNLLTAFRGSMKQRYAQKLVHKSEKLLESKFNKIKRRSNSPYKNISKDIHQFNIKRGVSQSSVSGSEALMFNLCETEKNDESPFDLKTHDLRKLQKDESKTFRNKRTEDLSTQCKSHKKGDKKVVPSLIK